MKSIRIIILILVSVICVSLQIKECRSQWMQTNLQNSSTVKSIAVKGDTIYAGTIFGEIFKSVNGGNNWFSVNNGYTSSFSIDALLIKDSDVYAGIDAGGVYKTTNGGSNWFPVNNGLRGLYIHALVDNNSEIFAVGDSAVYRSTNNAASWTPILQMTQNFFCLAVNGNSIFVGASTAGVFRSTNGGINWSAANNGIPPGGVVALAVSNGNIFAGNYGSGVYKSTDNGANWILNIPDWFVKGFEVNGNDMYFTGAGGIFKTTNNGTTWLDWNHGLVSGPYTYIIVSSEDYLYTGGITVWKRSTLPTLNLKVNLEAYSPNSDSVTVYLRHSTAPYEIADQAKGLLTSSLDLWVNFENVLEGLNYYIIVKHRNSLETWSKSGGEAFTSGFLAYDFTSAQSQAYGNNLTLSGGIYSVYSGDVNNDGIVDGSDLMLISNDAANFLLGYVPTDLNGNSFVDATDLVYADNNSYNSVVLIRP